MIGVTVKVCITEGHIHVFGSVSVSNPNPAFHDFFIDLDYEKHENDTEMCGHAYVEPCGTPASSPRSRRDTSQSNTDDQVVYLSIEARDKDTSFAVKGIPGDVYQDVIDAPTPDSKTWTSVFHYPYVHQT